MNLPTIETPRYTCTLPVTNLEVSYRPFLVGEQKSLLITQEADDVKNSVKEVFRLLDVCTDIDISALESTDIEFLFLKIRIVSVGETSEVGLECSNCKEQNIVTINYLDHQLIQPEKQVDKLLKLNDTIQVELKMPSIIDLADIQDITGEIADDNPITTFAILNKCVNKIVNGDEVLTRDDFSDKDLDQFLEGMTIDMLTDMMEYIKHQPKLVVPAEFECQHCNHSNKTLIEGLDNFFV